MMNLRKVYRDSFVIARKVNNIYFFSELNVSSYFGGTKKKYGFTSYCAKIVSDVIIQNYKCLSDITPSGNVVDVQVQVEKNINGVDMPFSYIVRNASSKNVTEIDNQIREYKKENETGNHYLGYFPFFIRRLAFWILKKSTKLRRVFLGTISITSVGSIGKNCGFVQPITMLPFCLAIGSLFDRDTRKYVKFTFAFNHDMIDGGDCARFIDLVQEKLMEECEKLE